MKSMLSLRSGWRTHTRNPEDTAQDVLLLLYLLNKSDSTGEKRLEAQLKVMKLAFLSEYQMSVKRMYKGLNFFFNIFKLGPSSVELLNLLDLLVEKKLVSFNPKKPGFSLTGAGKRTIEEFVESVGNNREFFGIIDEIIKKYDALTTEQLLKKVYSMDITPMHSVSPLNIGRAVKDNPKKRLLMRLEKREAKKEFRVPEEWVNTIDILLNTGVYA